MKDTIVYKVVEEKTSLEKHFRTISSSLRTSKRRFCSCVVFHLNCAVSYDIDKTTKSKIGKLFAFDSLHLVRQFAMPFRIILECKAENVEKLNYVGLSFDSSEKIRMFWENKPYNHKKIIGRIPPPSGTVVCSSITPIRIIR